MQFTRLDCEAGLHGVAEGLLRVLRHLDADGAVLQQPLPVQLPEVLLHAGIWSIECYPMTTLWSPQSPTSMNVMPQLGDDGGCCCLPTLNRNVLSVQQKQLLCAAKRHACRRAGAHARTDDQSAAHRARTTQRDATRCPKRLAFTPAWPPACRGRCRRGPPGCGPPPPAPPPPSAAAAACS